jgi:hypothetical protein
LILLGFTSDSFLIGNDWVSLLDWALSVLLLKILKADLDMKLTTSSNNMLTGFFSDAKY